MRDRLMGEALDVMHALVLDTGARWGEVATPDQRMFARVALVPDPAGPRLLWHEAPKGYSKSTDTGGCRSPGWWPTHPP
jgi:hypothetical protein